MKRILTGLALLLAVATSYAQSVAGSTTSTLTGSSTSQSANSGQGNGNTIISNGADHESITERNVSAGVLGAFASSVNQFNCTYTKAGANVAVPGFSGTVQASANDTDFCVKGWTQAELNRQSVITTDPATKAALQQAATNVKCTLDDDIYDAMVAAGVNCMSKPTGYADRHKTQIRTADGSVATVRYVPVYETAQVPK